jgi:hypothetical protein
VELVGAFWSMLQPGEFTESWYGVGLQVKVEILAWKNDELGIAGHSWAPFLKT